ncbi:MAG: U32 family peptidase [Bacilli bacterium]|nr:U32 family peptidase [Bacilli bacterium]
MKHELLVPAGNMDALKQAVANGADAVYVGCENFGARKFADNFTNDEMIYAIKLCHLYGVRLYATMNTLIKDDEVLPFLTQVEFLYKNGIDAILVQDFGMMMLMREKYPNLEIHASTQANVSSKDTCEFFYNLGIKRVVFSREMTLKEIESIKVPIEKEVFIHGALCTSYSGCCLMSSSIGPRSANRGECVGCCRLPYSLKKNNQIIKNNKYLLSMKELNTSTRFKELLDSDITSFKIEGRMKSPEYVGFITRFYRGLIDNQGDNINIDEENDLLKTIYNRGFTEGHLFSDKDLINEDNPNHIGLEIGKVIEVTKEKIKIKLNRDLHQEDGIRFLESGKGFIVNYLYDETGKLANNVEAGKICMVDNKVELTKSDKVCKTLDHLLMKDLQKLPARQIPITLKVTAKANTPLTIEISDGVNNLKEEGKFVEVASTSPITDDRIREQVEKLGDTPFISTSTVVDSSPNIFINIQEINELRRKLVSDLMNARMTNKKEAPIMNIQLTKPDTDKETGITVTTLTTEQSDFIYRKSYNRYYFTKDKDYNNRAMNSKSYYKLPRCGRKISENLKVRTLVGDYFDFTKRDFINGDYPLNVTNIYTAYYLYKCGIDVVTPSVELNEAEVINLINNFVKTFKTYPRLEVLAYGRIENMIIKGNILNIIANDYSYSLIDNQNREFPVYYDGTCTHILNYQGVELKQKKILKDYVVLRYDFYKESTDEIKNILN